VPALGDYLTPLCQRVFDLLAAETQWTTKIQPAARLSRFLATDRWPNLAPARRSPRIVWDFRLVRGTPRPADPEPGLTTTFGSVASATAPRTLFKQYTLEHKLTHPDLVQTDATLLETVFELVMMRAGPQLTLNASPLAYVRGCLPITTSYDETTATPNGDPRLVQTITHPADVTLKTVDILG
jgi:hypothetical protein